MCVAKEVLNSIEVFKNYTNLQNCANIMSGTVYPDLYWQN